MRMDHGKQCSHCGAGDLSAFEPYQETAVKKKRSPVYILIGVTAGVLAITCIVVFAVVMIVQTKDAAENTIPWISAESEENSAAEEEDKPEVTSAREEESSMQENVTIPSDLGAETGIYDAGEYLVGEDFTAGTYIAVEEDEPGLVLTVSADEEETQDYYCYAWVRGSVIFEVEDGQYLHATNCRLYNVEKVDMTLDPFSHPGIFRVGVDIEPGTYVTEPYGEHGPRSCEVYSQLTPSGPVLCPGRVEIADDAFTMEGGYATVTVQEGEYLYLNGCILKKQ